jgi:hypothetical protein
MFIVKKHNSSHHRQKWLRGKTAIPQAFVVKTPKIHVTYTSVVKKLNTRMKLKTFLAALLRSVYSNQSSKA